MGYIDTNLLPGETLVARARLHRVVFTRAAVVAVIGAATLYFYPLAGAIVLMAALALAVPPFVASKSSEFGVTNRRVVIKTGVVRRRTLELLLRQVEAISVDQSVMGRLLNYGTIALTGTGGVKEEFHNIARPLEFRRSLHAQSVAQDER